MPKIIEVIKGDITSQKVHAIVNAAHDGLTGGGGVDGAIHKAAGSLMTGECMNLPKDDKGERCKVGECRMTSGYNLSALYIIHTVGPVWRGGKFGERTDLARCYYNCFLMAEMQGLRSIAFPCISTGAFALPKNIAAKIAVDAIKNSFTSYAEQEKYGEPEKNCSISLVRFVCFDQENYDEYMKIMPKGYEEVENGKG